MTTNETAAETLNDAITKLLLTYDGAPPADRVRIRFSANRLKEEYDRVKKRKAASTYSEVTGGITKAAGRLKTIAADRERLATALVSAASLLDIITRVLGLISK